MRDMKFDEWMRAIGQKRVAAHISVHVGETNTGALRAKINGSLTGALAELDHDAYRVAHAALVFVENIRDHGTHAAKLAEYTTFRELALAVAKVTP